MRFNQNQKFRIMVIADTHGTYGTRPETLDLMDSALESVKPDLVVFTGDNIHGPNYKIKGDPKLSEEAIRQIMRPVTSRNIPFCTVFGNHDDEGGFDKKRQIEVYRSLPNCLTSCGDYNITLRSHDGERDVLNLWFIDSGTYNRDKTVDSYYAFVTDEQIAWYKRKSDELREKNSGKPLPSLLFQHMPVTEIFDLLERAYLPSKNTIFKNGRLYRLKRDITEGELGEYPCPPYYNNGQFSAWKKQGDIVAAFFGHDHVNDFVGTLDGIDLVHTPGAGFDTYGNGLKHGVRIIDLDERKPDSYETKMLYYKDLVGTKVQGGRYLWRKGEGSRSDKKAKFKRAACISSTALFVVCASVGAYVIKDKTKR